MKRNVFKPVLRIQSLSLIMKEGYVGLNINVLWSVQSFKSFYSIGDRQLGSRDMDESFIEK